MAFTLPDVGNIDPSRLSRGRGTPGSEPDFLPYNKKGRDPFMRISFNTGVYWLGGFLGGGAYGFVQGWRGATSTNYKIRFNSVMNGVSKNGSKWGNMLGLVAFLHTFSGACMEWGGLESYVPGTMVPHTVPLLSGAITGGLFFSNRGPKGIALATAGGALLSWCYAGAGGMFEETFGRRGRF